MPSIRPRDGITASLAQRKPHYRRKHRYANAFAHAEHHTIATQLRNCQETEVLACCSNCGASWYIVNRCRLRICPLCAYEQSQKRERFAKALIKHMDYPKLLTLTMPLWHGDPKKGIQFLRTAWNRLRRTKLFQPVIGGLYTIELKVKPSGWHIHMHVLMDAPYLPYQHLFSAWRKIIQAAAPQVDIRAATTHRQQAYVCKDVAKSADAYEDPNAIVKWYNATNGLRLFATFGKWFNVKLAALDPSYVPDKKPQACPRCGETHTTFLARDGPFVFGHDLWREVQTVYGVPEQYTRPIETIKIILQQPDAQPLHDKQLTLKMEAA